MPDSELQLMGVVLCGGLSNRMGRDKALLETLAGVTFLEHAYERLRFLCSDVRVSASLDRVTKYKLIADPPDPHGPITGIHSALTLAAADGFDACVFTPVDTPNLTTDHLETLIDAYRDRRDQIVCAVDHDDPDRVQPLIAIYPTILASAIAESISEGRYSPRRFLNSRSVVRVPMESSACKNINTPTDLHNLINDL